MESELALSERIETARKTVDQVTYEVQNLHAIAALTSSLHVDGHRADLVILKAAKANAAFEGRAAIDESDIARAAELALPHRLRRGPFQQAEIKLTELEDRIEQIQSQAGGSPQSEPEALEEQELDRKKVSARA
jgi:Mg-chelatase subunit ChlI